MATKKTTAENIEEVTSEEVTPVEVEETKTEVAETEVEETETEETTDETAEAKVERLTKAGKHSAKAIREAEEEAARQAAKLERAEREAAGEEEPKAPKRQLPNPLHQHGKKYRAARELVDRFKHYSLEEALELAAKTSTTKFDSSVEIHVNLGVDPRQADQMVRATVVLPHGTGKTVRVAVFADGKLGEDAKTAGADIVGTEELLAAIEKGKLDFDILIAQPAGMAVLGKVARILGPRGLMPNPKSGTVTQDVVKAVTDAKAGKVEFRIDKQAIVHQAVGKVGFKAENLLENAQAFLSAVLKAKPAAGKGQYVKAVTVTTTMGPGIKVDAAATTAALSGKK
jgi:large subunit ribosomal protein L1